LSLEEHIVKKFFLDLFGKKKPPENIKTAPLTEDQLENVSRQTVKLEPSQIIVGIGQSMGKQRDQNDDTLFMLNAMQANTNNNIPFAIFIIADGMGGYQFGDMASMTAVRVMSGILMRKLYLPFFNVEPESPGESLQEVMRGAVIEAQQAVVKAAPGGGTTLTTVVVMGGQITVAHVGDSRAYFIFPDGRMQTLTRDHSLVKRLSELGQITEKEAAVHPQRNVLYRALGQGEPFEPDISTFPFPQPAYLMLCSDGLWNVLSEGVIYRIITEAENPAIACRDLVHAANEAGGPDNISVILAYYPN
jgi:serine/threonine protein phosphatase PrpC